MIKRSIFLFKFVFSLFILLNFVNAFSGEGNGTLSEPYVITNCSQLNETRNDLTANYKLNQSIDCSESHEWNYGEVYGYCDGDLDYSNQSSCESAAFIWISEEGYKGFIPIGNSTSAFNGSLNGNGFNITGLYMYYKHPTYSAYMGLFGFLKGNVSNLLLENVNISSGSYNVGSLAGAFCSEENRLNSLFNISSTGIINSGNSGGGLIGGSGDGCNGIEIYNSYSSVFINSSGSYIGGIAGYFYGSQMFNSYFTGNVIGSNDVGGLIGQADGNVNVSYSYSNGNIEGSYNVGGIAGYYISSTINNSYSRGYVTGYDDVGGLIGELNGGIVYNSYSTGNVTGEGEGAGGLIGESNGGEIYNSYSTGNVTGEDYVASFVGDNSGIIDNSYWLNSTYNSELECHDDGNEGCIAIEDRNYFYDYDNSPMRLSSGLGWDFTNVWSNAFNELDYPVFQWQNASINIETVLTENGGNNQQENSGSSGSRYAPKIYYTNEKLSSEGNIFNLTIDDKIKFVINFSNHTLTLNKFNLGSANIKIESELITAWIKKGIFYHFDLDKDGINDIRVKYSGTNKALAEIFVQEIINSDINNSADDKEINKEEIKIQKDSNYFGILFVFMIGVICIFTYIKRRKIYR